MLRVVDTQTQRRDVEHRVACMKIVIIENKCVSSRTLSLASSHHNIDVWSSSTRGVGSPTCSAWSACRMSRRVRVKVPKAYGCVYVCTWCGGGQCVSVLRMWEIYRICLQFTAVRCRLFLGALPPPRKRSLTTRTGLRFRFNAHVRFHMLAYSTPFPFPFHRTRLVVSRLSILVNECSSIHTLTHNIVALAHERTCRAESTVFRWYFMYGFLLVLHAGNQSTKGKYVTSAHLCTIISQCQKESAIDVLPISDQPAMRMRVVPWIWRTCCVDRTFCRL